MRANTAPLAILLVIAIGWTWTSFLSQLVFLMTFRKSAIKTSHLLRCAVYGSDTAVLWFVPFAVTFSSFGASFYLFGNPNYSTIIGIPVGLSAQVSVLVLFVLLPYRLIQASCKYLRFPHALVIATLASVISILMLMSLLSILIPNIWRELGLIDWLILWR